MVPGYLQGSKHSTCLLHPSPFPTLLWLMLIRTLAGYWQEQARPFWGNRNPPAIWAASKHHHLERCECDLNDFSFWFRKCRLVYGGRTQLQHGQPNVPAQCIALGWGSIPRGTSALLISVCFLVAEVQRGSSGSSFGLTPPYLLW